MLTTNILFQEAEQFINMYYDETRNNSLEAQKRLTKIEHEIENHGTYEHTFEELVYGAKIAWRNSNRCIGRLFWDKLHVLDARTAHTPEEIYEALLHHIAFATNKGRIKPTITIFKQNHVTIWNHQLIRYAGYETTDGIIGDSNSLAFTKMCQDLGWHGNMSHYDVLPLVFSIGDGEPYCFPIPNEYITEVTIEHPNYPNFTTLDAKWYGVPMIADMRLEIGGISYEAAPFNGWYMGTEIGTRNLADTDRYNLLPKVADIIGLDRTKNSSLWKDRSLVELNIAVLHSFKKSGVTIVDHHTAAAQFKQFEEQEAACGRLVTGNWVWLIPPMSPTTTHIYHKPYKNEVNKPNYFHQSRTY